MGSSLMFSWSVTRSRRAWASSGSMAPEDADVASDDVLRRGYLFARSANLE